MASWRIEWRRSALRDLRRVDAQSAARVIAAVEGLASDPFPNGCRKLVGAKQSWRIRVGDYRVVYSPLEEIVTIDIVRVVHRRDVYRDLS